LTSEESRKLHELVLKGKAAAHWKSRRVCFYRCISAFSIFLSHTRRRRIMCGKLFVLISAVLLLALSTGQAWADYEVLTGNYWSHDPVMTRQGNTYYSFCTGQRTPIRYSTDMHNWALLGYVWPTPNAVSWWAQQVPAFDDPPNNCNIWAPDISYFNDKYHLYYSISSSGTDSCIGLATNTTLDPSDPCYAWVDSGGPVICSETGYSYNCIDPALFIDTHSTPTRYWLAFGSFWTGIKMREIDPNTGLLLASNPNFYSIASRGAFGAIEASFIIFKDGYYYLFVSFDSCCNGASSTYNIRVGRATSVTGTYYDRNGTSMMSSGGNRLTWNNEAWKGPGHQAVFLNNDGRYWLVHHAYRASDGWAGLRIHELFWDSNGWPTLDDPAPVDVNEALVAWWNLDEGSGTTAEDSSGNGYDGAISGATWVIGDPCRITDLSFDGINDYVELSDEPVTSFDGLTISLWAYPTSVKTSSRFIDAGNGAGSNNIYFARSGTTTSLVFMVYNGTDGTLGTVTTATGAIELNKWQHFAVTSDVCGYTVVYKNGVPIKTGTTSPPWHATRIYNYIARSNWSADAYYEGRLDDIRIYNKALDANDIKDIYGQGLASGTCLLVRSHGKGLIPDWKQDCYINFYDLAVMANGWLNGYYVPDLANLAAGWLQCNNPQDANCEPNW
jgi:arabinan endo-1,5-alpha-L-arabinosidase